VKVKQSKKFLTLENIKPSKILNASAFADFQTKNQFTPSYAQRRVSPTAPKGIGKINSRGTNLVGTPAHCSEIYRIFSHNSRFSVSFYPCFLEQTLYKSIIQSI